MAEHTHKIHKHNKIKTLRSSFAYVYVAVMSSGDMVGISISLRERLLADQQALYSYVDHEPSLHNSNISISISRKLVLMQQPSPLTHKLLIFMLMLMIASQVRTRLSAFKKNEKKKNTKTLSKLEVN